MKTINKLFLTLFAIVSLVACNDAIEIDPIGQLTEDITFETVNDLQLGLNGAYALYTPENEIYYNSVFADNTKPGVDNGGQGINLHNWAVTADQVDVRAIWNSYYSLINQCNRVLEASAFVTPTAAEQADYDNILGQVRALRAFSHFQMLQYFTEDATDDNALSIIISSFVPSIDQVFPRNTNGEVFEFINEDLDAAEALLSSAQTSNTLVSQDFITALRARMAITRGQNTQAMGFAQTLIDAYPLANQTEYQNIFLDTEDTEVIFKSVRTAADGLIGGLWYFTNSAGPFFEVSNGLYESFESGDVRLGVNINFNTNNGGPSVPADNLLLINKYPGNSTPFLSDAKIFRVSEMHLIKAEAQARENMLGAAALSLQVLRNARFGGATLLDDYNSISEAVNAVYEERRLELAFEGHRFLDQKRFNKGMVRDDIDCESGGSCVLPASDFRYTLPIPQVEVDANPSITQNPGYNN